MEEGSSTPYMTPGDRAVKILLARRPEDIVDESKFFRPDMCHQIFGASESIYGYTGLDIKIMYNANTFQCFIEDRYDELVDMAKGDQILKPDNYKRLIEEWLPENSIPSLESFRQSLNPANMLCPFGRFFRHFAQKIDGSIKHYQVYSATNKVTGYADFHNRMQTIIVWFIDAANYIALDDDKWRFLILYEKVMVDGDLKYFPVGYTTIYQYYAFPDKHRYRISQFIIFPPFQNRGLGAKFLRIVYSYIASLGNVKDFTVEDPSDKFQTLRDFVDLTLCLKSPSVKTYVKQVACKKFTHMVRDTHKINVRQARHIFDILIYYYLDESNPLHMRYFEKHVKRKLNMPYKRVDLVNKMFSNHVDQEENEKRLKTIDANYQTVLSRCRHVIANVKSSRPKK